MFQELRLVVAYYVKQIIDIIPLNTCLTVFIYN